MRLHGAQPRAAIEQPRSFLFRIARNLLTDHFRRTRRPQLALDDPDIADLLADCAPLPEQMLQSQAWWARYEVGLDQLTPKCRTVFVKCRIEGLTHAQIAAELGISQKMVEKYMTQALISLRHDLSEFLDGDASER